MISKLNAKAAARKHGGTAMLVAVAALAAIVPEVASASSASTGAPWEGPLQSFVDSITGPVAMGVATIAAAGTIMMLVFGGEMNDFVRKMLYLVLGIASLVSISGLVTFFGGGNGAVIAAGASMVGLG